MGTFGEWQGGFRKGRRIDDQIFILTQVVEMCGRTGKGCVVGFCDLRRAFDTVDRGKIFEILRNEGVPLRWVQLIEELYTGTSVIFKEKEVCNIQIIHQLLLFAN